MPRGELLGELGHDEERAPSALLLRLDNVAEDVVSHVQHVFASRADELREDIAVAARVHLVLFEWTCVATEFLHSRRLLFVIVCFFKKILKNLIMISQSLSIQKQ